jgi:hypothetical protein
MLIKKKKEWDEKCLATQTVIQRSLGTVLSVKDTN